MAQKCLDWLGNLRKAYDAFDNRTTTGTALHGRRKKDLNRYSILLAPFVISVLCRNLAKPINSKILKFRFSHFFNRYTNVLIACKYQVCTPNRFRVIYGVKTY